MHGEQCLAAQVMSGSEYICNALAESVSRCNEANDCCLFEFTLCVTHDMTVYVHVTLIQSLALIAFAEGLVIDCSIGQISSFLQDGADQIVHFCAMDLV